MKIKSEDVTVVERNTMVLDGDEAGLVVKPDGTMDLYFPDHEEGDPATATALLVVALARYVTNHVDHLMAIVDEVGDIAKELEKLENESVTGDTKEASDEEGTGEETTD